VAIFCPASLPGRPPNACRDFEHALSSILFLQGPIVQAALALMRDVRDRIDTLAERENLGSLVRQCLAARVGALHGVLRPVLLLLGCKHSRQVWQLTATFPSCMMRLHFSSCLAVLGSARPPTHQLTVVLPCVAIPPAQRVLMDGVKDMRLLEEEMAQHVSKAAAAHHAASVGREEMEAKLKEALIRLGVRVA